jgi:hypothetical protein
MRRHNFASLSPATALAILALAAPAAALDQYSYQRVTVPSGYTGARVVAVADFNPSQSGSYVAVGSAVAPNGRTHATAAWDGDYGFDGVGFMDLHAALGLEARGCTSSKATAVTNNHRTADPIVGPRIAIALGCIDWGYRPFVAIVSSAGVEMRSVPMPEGATSFELNAILSYNLGDTATHEVVGTARFADGSSKALTLDLDVLAFVALPAVGGAGDSEAMAVCEDMYDDMYAIGGRSQDAQGRSVATLWRRNRTTGGVTAQSLHPAKASSSRLDALSGFQPTDPDHSTMGQIRAAVGSATDPNGGVHAVAWVLSRDGVDMVELGSSQFAGAAAYGVARGTTPGSFRVVGYGFKDDDTPWEANVWNRAASVPQVEPFAVSARLVAPGFNCVNSAFTGISPNGIVTGNCETAEAQQEPFILRPTRTLLADAVRVIVGRKTRLEDVRSTYLADGVSYAVKAETSPQGARQISLVASFEGLFQRNESDIYFMLTGNGVRSGGASANARYDVEVRRVDPLTGDPQEPPLGTLTFGEASSTASQLWHTSDVGLGSTHTVVHLRITSSAPGPFGFEFDALSVHDGPHSFE